MGCYYADQIDVIVGIVRYSLAVIVPVIFVNFFTLTFIIYCTFTIPFLKPLSSSRGEG